MSRPVGERQHSATSQPCTGQGGLLPRGGQLMVTWQRNRALKICNPQDDGQEGTKHKMKQKTSSKTGEEHSLFSDYSSPDQLGSGWGIVPHSKRITALVPVPAGGAREATYPCFSSSLPRPLKINLQRDRDGKRGGETSVCGCLSHTPYLGTRPDQACALTGN